MPLADHLNDVEKNIKMMFKQLLDEANDAKKMRASLDEAHEKIGLLKAQLRSKKDLITFAKRKVLNFEYSVARLLKEEEQNAWTSSLKQISKQFFEEDNTVNKILEKNQQIGAILDPSQKLIKNVVLDTDEILKDELLHQRDLMSKKAAQLTTVNKVKEKEKDDIVIRVMNENTNLINECNSLREEKKRLLEHRGQMLKVLSLTKEELARLEEASNYLF